MSGRRRKMVLRETRERRRTCLKPSYDEKKQKKSPIAFSDLFSAWITECNRAGELKPQILPRTEYVMTQYYRMPTTEFQIAAT
jgi:hypothetical protein